MDTILLTGLFAAFSQRLRSLPEHKNYQDTQYRRYLRCYVYHVLTGVISWIAYGIMRSDFAVLIANIVTLFLAAPVLVITLINRRKKHV